MRWPPKFILSLILLCFCRQASLLEAKLGFSNLLSLETGTAWQNEVGSYNTSLLLQPEATARAQIGDKLELYAEGSVQICLESDLDAEHSAEAELYRLFGRIDYQGWELRAGLQQLNFGSAKVLRPLQWFDQIDPQDRFKLTSGVSGILLRHYFPSRLGLWAWGILTEDGTGFDGIDAKTEGPELGARLEVPLAGLETGFSIHNRTFKTGFWEQEYRETRLGLDLRYDGWIGAWLEATASAFEQKDLDEIPESTCALALGADYTIGIANGLYLMQEISWQDYSAHLNYYPNNTRLASMISYPLGLLDNMQFLHLYDHNIKRRELSLGWQRNYDYLSWELRINHTRQSQVPPIYSLNFRISYNI